MSDTDIGRVGLAGGFIAALVTAQFLAVKILVIPLPGTVPVVGDAILLPAGVIAIAITFLATDCYTELYGAPAAHRLVNVGFATLALMLALLWLAIALPGSDMGVDPVLFAEVLAPSTNIVVGGLLGYVVSQHWDVFVFDALRRRTGTPYLWLRNLLSTGTSQAIDTAIFILVGFWLAPTLLGLGDPLPAAALASLLVGQYLAKLGLAILDTPFVYAIVGLARRGDPFGVKASPSP